MNCRLFVFLLAAWTSTVTLRSASSDLHRIARTDRPGTAWSVRAADGPLVFTGQIAAPDPAAGAGAQVRGALDALATTLAQSGSDLTRIVRLNAYVADAEVGAAIETAVAERFRPTPVAFAAIRTPLAQGARVAFEAVATSTRTTERVDRVSPDIAVLPAGAKLFISGQAERGPDLAAAVKLTMAGLQRSLAHLGLKADDVVQVKAFIQPFDRHADARREIAASFGPHAVPPIVMMEWVSELFAEIEIVVSARALPPPAEPLAHSWLPWLTKSPRYCHVGLVAAGTPLIFVGAIEGDERTDARAQMKTIFERVGSALFEAGSSYRHLAKATYYLGDPKTRALLGDIRGVYFDPTRPPAASALEMKTLGGTGRAALVDLIAVPVK